MKLRERFSHFWNETLGVDYPQTENIEESNLPEYDELKDSLSRVQAIEKKYKKQSTGKNIVKKVSVNEKNAAKVAEAKNGSKEQAEESKEK